jgi:hypothetical protein
LYQPLPSIDDCSRFWVELALILDLGLDYNCHTLLTMPLTATQIASFFTDGDQMGIPQPTREKLKDEGIENPSDLADFDKDTLHQVAENLRKPGDRIANPDPNAAVGSTIARPPYVFGAKSQKRLLETSELVRFYTTIGRPLTAANIRYEPVTKDFTEQWKALTARKSESDAEVPKISKALPIIKWTEAFDDFLSRTVGARNIPLSYVTRDIAIVPPNAPDLQTNKPHSIAHGSVEGDLIARASHEHALFRDDNSKVYYFLEEATRGTAYAASLKPFQRKKAGRDALKSLKTQYAGRDKWEAEIKIQDDLLHNRIWKGQSNFSLEKFIAQHRNAYVSMHQCSQHVDFQLPNEHTRVGYLLDAIQTSDAGLQAAIAQIKTDDNPTGKRNSFESTASYLLPYDPVARKRQLTGKRDHDATISDVSVEVSAGFGSKPGIGKSGVHLRYHTKAEYSKLSSDQKLDLKEWREKNGNKESGKRKKDGKSVDSKNSKKHSKSMVAAVSKEIAKLLQKKTDNENDDEDVNAIIMSLQTQPTQTPSETTKKARFEERATTQVSTSALKSIIKRVRNKKDE